MSLNNAHTAALGLGFQTVVIDEALKAAHGPPGQWQPNVYSSRARHGRKVIVSGASFRERRCLQTDAGAMLRDVLTGWMNPSAQPASKMVVGV